MLPIYTSAESKTNKGIIVIVFSKFLPLLQWPYCPEILLLTAQSAKGTDISHFLRVSICFSGCKSDMHSHIHT
jgi:hypothetical protein